MSKRAEQRALEAYAQVWDEEQIRMAKIALMVDAHSKQRACFEEGYEAAQKDLGWISVKERLPEELEWVFVCVDMQGRPQCVGLAYRNHGEWCDDENDPGFSVDYWMPIPELPKEK